MTTKDIDDLLTVLNRHGVTKFDGAIKVELSGNAMPVIATISTVPFASTSAPVAAPAVDLIERIASGQNLEGLGPEGLPTVKDYNDGTT